MAVTQVVLPSFSSFSDLTHSGDNMRVSTGFTSFDVYAVMETKLIWMMPPTVLPERWINVTKYGSDIDTLIFVLLNDSIKHLISWYHICNKIPWSSTDAEGASDLLLRQASNVKEFEYDQHGMKLAKQGSSSLIRWVMLVS